MKGPYKLLSILEEEVHTSDKIASSQAGELRQSFLRYLREPRYQSPLTIEELSKLFHYFYKDLHSVIIQQFTASQSTKKQLIGNSEFLNKNPKVFDYLLAIANYSTSSIKLLRRDDPDALYQLRVFNYYKLLVIFENLEREQYELFNSASNSEDNTLYDKIFRFDQKDIIYQEFLEVKLASLKNSALSFKHFIDISDESSMNYNDRRLSEFVENLTDEDLTHLNKSLHDLKTNITPFSKLTSIMHIHKALISLFVENGFKSSDLNNDIILPTLIYLIIYKLDYQSDLYLNLKFVQHFLFLFEPDRVELYNIGAGSSYTPMERSTKTLANKYRICNFFDLLNLNDVREASEEEDANVAVSESFEFFNNDKDLIEFISKTLFNHGELLFYLTNFEAVITYLSNVTIGDLLKIGTATTRGTASASSSSLDEEVSSEFSNKFLNQSITSLVDEELDSHFQLPKGKLEEEILAQKAEQEKKEHDQRSRSSSLMNVINNKINETRSRSNSGILGGLKNKESFPSVEGDHDNSGSMMRNILGRFSSVSVSQFRVPLEDDETDAQIMKEMGEEDNVFVTPLKKSVFMNRLSPSHTRTRSGSLEGTSHSKRNSITSKITSGVNELITKLNTAPGLNSAAEAEELEKNVSNSSLHSLETGSSAEVAEVQATSTRRPDHLRNRTTSLQIMDRWFSNISLNQQQTHQQASSNGAKNRLKVKPTSTESPSVEELTSFVNVDFDSMSIKDLRLMKEFYDHMCQSLISTKDESLARTVPDTGDREI